jgi:hypothetical protein
MISHKSQVESSADKHKTKVGGQATHEAKAHHPGEEDHDHGYGHGHGGCLYSKF